MPPKCMDPPCVARENGEAGVRSCTNVSGLALELVLRTIMEIRASDLVSGHASKGYFGGQFSDAPGRPILHLLSFSRRPRCDLPLAGRPVRLVIVARRFRCGADLCSRVIFTERFENDVLAPWARRTGRLD